MTRAKRLVDHLGRGQALLKAGISGVLLIILFLQVDLRGAMASVLQARWTGFGVALFLFVVGVFIRAFRWQILVKALNLGVSFGSLTALYFVGTFFNAVLPTGVGGDAVKAAELARRTGRAGESLGTIVIDRFLGIIVLMAIGLVALSVGAPVDRRLAWILGGFFGAGTVGYWLLRRRALIRRISHLIPRRLGERVRRPLAALYHGLQAYQPRALISALAASLLFNLLWILVNVLLGWSLRIELDLVYYMMFVPLVSLSLLLPSLGGLGVREMTYVGLFGLVGVAEEKAFALGILVYVINIATGMIGGTIYLVQGAREYRSRLEKQDC